MASDPSMRPLRFLFVLHHPWDPRLGAAQPQMAFAEWLETQGHIVTKLDRYDIFPGLRKAAATGSSRYFKLWELWSGPFARAAMRKVRSIADDFDVVDAHQGNLPGSKSAMGIRGLLVARSVGLAALYREWESEEHLPALPISLGGLHAALIRRRERREQGDPEKSFRAADLINVCNETERRYVSEHYDGSGKTEAFPLGISQVHFNRLAAANVTEHVRSDDAPKTIAFVGHWCDRKGRQDWPHIIARMREADTRLRFRLVGTIVSEDAIRAELRAEDRAQVEVCPRYTPEELPKLLEGVDLGLFPSYREGFGIALVEQFAAGVPVVAYDTPGPADIVPSEDWCVPLGDWQALCERGLAYLKSSEGSMTTRRDVRLRAQRFLWEAICSATFAAYRERAGVCGIPWGKVKP